MKLNRFQMAAVKRTVQNTKRLVIAKEKLQEKIVSIANQIDELNNEINAWENPIMAMTGGFTSSQVLAFDGELPDTSTVVEEGAPAEEELDIIDAEQTI